MSRLLGLGARFPEFSLQACVSAEPGSEFRIVDAHELEGTWSAVFFWPLDFTYVCPTELVEFNRRDPEELRRFGQEIFEQALTAPGTDDPAYLFQRTTATTLARRSIDETMAEHHLNAIMSPTNGPAWPTTYGDGDEGFGLESSGAPAVAGYPNVTVPAGYAGELPIGVSFFAGHWQDATVLAYAAAYEAANPARHAPRFLRGT